MTSYIDTTSFADAQTGTKVVFLNKKHTGMRYFENQNFTLETLIIIVVVIDN